MPYDNSKSKIHRRQRKVREDYGLNISVHSLYNLLMLRAEWIKSNEFVKGDYSKYMSRYKTISTNATEIGIEIPEPLRNPKDILQEIMNIFTDNRMTFKNDVDVILIDMGIKEEGKITRNPKGVASEPRVYLSVWDEETECEEQEEVVSSSNDNYDTEKEEIELEEQLLIDKYNSTI